MGILVYVYSCLSNTLITFRISPLIITGLNPKVHTGIELSITTSPNSRINAFIHEAICYTPDDGRVAQKPNHCDNSNKNVDIRPNLNRVNSSFLSFHRDKFVNDMLKILVF